MRYVTCVRRFDIKSNVGDGSKDHSVVVQNFMDQWQRERIVGCVTVCGKNRRIWCDEMDSEADAETTAANAVDSDGSVSWEDFFGEFVFFDVSIPLYVLWWSWNSSKLEVWKNWIYLLDCFMWSYSNRTVFLQNRYSAVYTNFDKDPGYLSLVNLWFVK